MSEHVPQSPGWLRALGLQGFDCLLTPQDNGWRGVIPKESRRLWVPGLTEHRLQQCNLIFNLNVNNIGSWNYNFRHKIIHLTNEKRKRQSLQVVTTEQDILYCGLHNTGEGASGTMQLERTKGANLLSVWFFSGLIGNLGWHWERVINN